MPMGIFNPLMLDASIRDVVSSLPLDKKVDVLLYSLQHLPANSRSVTDLAYHSQPPVHIDDHSTAAAALSIVEFRSRTIIENAVQSCLQTVPIHQENVIKARLIRAKARFAAGLRGAAHQGERSFIDGSRNAHPIQTSFSDLQSILLLDPDHTEARQLLPQMGNRSYAPGEVRAPAPTSKC